MFDRFLQQMEHGVRIADVKYPRNDGYRVMWLFDHSSCHNAYANNALNAAHMNAKPGGKQPCLRDTVWNGKVQRMVFNIGIPKGLIQVLKDALDSVTNDNITNYFRKAKQYMFAYLEGHVAGPELENFVKKYKKVLKSHRKEGVSD